MASSGHANNSSMLTRPHGDGGEFAVTRLHEHFPCDWNKPTSGARAGVGLKQMFNKYSQTTQTTLQARLDAKRLQRGRKQRLKRPRAVGTAVRPARKKSRRCVRSTKKRSPPGPWQEIARRSS